MTDGKNKRALMVRAKTPVMYNRTLQVSPIQRGEVGKSEYI